MSPYELRVPNDRTRVPEPKYAVAFSNRRLLGELYQKVPNPQNRDFCGVYSKDASGAIRNPLTEPSVTTSPSSPKPTQTATSPQSDEVDFDNSTQSEERLGSLLKLPKPKKSPVEVQSINSWRLAMTVEY